MIADTAEADAADGDVLVNLAAAVPPDAGDWERIAEVIDSDAGRAARAASVSARTATAASNPRRTR